ncbi:MAG: NAD(P)-binding domain-containing protein [Saprospiraceae bacterium]|nr:NAD(P)-binding domain-containing protein [Saprospiraceae bacterium]
MGFENVLCFEQNDQIGGNWVYSAESSHSSVVNEHILLVPKLSEYTDFPMPDEYSDYPSHREVLAYFQSYCEHFKLYPFIRFNSKVQKIDKIENERWRIKVNEETHEFDYILIANGHHNMPNHPEFKADFTGKYLHAHDYKNNNGFEGKRVFGRWCRKFWLRLCRRN